MHGFIMKVVIILAMVVVMLPVQLRAQTEGSKSPQETRVLQVTLPEGTLDKNTVELKNQIKKGCGDCLIQEINPQSSKKVDSSIPSKNPSLYNTNDMTVEPIDSLSETPQNTGPRACEAPKHRDKYGVCRD